MHLLRRGGGAFIKVVEIFHGVKIIIGMEELLALDPEHLGNTQRLVRDLAVQTQQPLQFVGRQKVPVNHRAASAPKFGMVGGHQGFNFRVEPAIHGRMRMHEPHGVPMNVVVYQPARVLEVEPFGKHVGRGQDAGLVSDSFKEVALRRPVVVGGEGPR